MSEERREALAAVAAVRVEAQASQERTQAITQELTTIRKALEALL